MVIVKIKNDSGGAQVSFWRFSLIIEVWALEVGPLKPIKGSGKRCKLPQWGLGQSPSHQRFCCILWT